MDNDNASGHETLADFIDALHRPGKRTAIISLGKEEGRTWTYGELHEQVQRLAAGLLRTNDDSRPTIALLADPGPEWVVACLAAVRAGLVATPIDVQSSDDVLRHIIEDSQSEIIFTTHRQRKRLDDLNLSRDRTVALLDAAEDDQACWRRWLSDEAGELPPVDADDTAILFYTSGTTGAPKGVPLCHRNIAYQIKTLSSADFIGEDDRVLLPLPLHHVYPLVVGMLAPLSIGLPVVLPFSLTGPQIRRALNECSATIVIGVPRLYEAFMDGIQARLRSTGRLASVGFRLFMGLNSRLPRSVRRPLGRWLLRPIHNEFGRNLRVLASGGSPLDARLAGRLEATGWQVAIGYGLTETSPLVTLNLPGGGKLASVGRPIPGTEVRIDHTAQPDGDAETVSTSATTENRDAGKEAGEILVRGPGVFTGYHRLPDKTKESLENGWFRTGDLGYLDHHNYLYVTGRVSTMIVTAGGENVQPDDIEEAYAQSPAIREIGVLEENGKLAALVVPETEVVREAHESGESIRSALESAIQKHSKRVPSYQRLGQFQIHREALPRTRLGKIRRHKLKRLYEQAAGSDEGEQTHAEPMDVAEMSAQDRALLDDPAVGKTWELLAQKYPDRHLTPDTLLRLDLDIDSMEWLNLSLQIRDRTGVELDEEAIARAESVRDLLEEVSAGTTRGDQRDDIDPLEDPERFLSDEHAKYLQPRGAFTAAASRVMYGLNRSLMKRIYRLDIHGSERLPAGPFIIAPNHASYLDAPVVAAALSWSQLRHTFWGGFVGAVFSNPLMRTISRLARVVPIDPQRGVMSSLAFAAAILRRGDNLVWFPEGERSPDGRLQSFKPGIGLLLQHLSLPVVPTWIEGTYEALPIGKKTPRLRQLRIAFGEPLHPEELGKQEGSGSEPPTPQQLADALRRAVSQVRDNSFPRKSSPD